MVPGGAGFWQVSFVLHSDKAVESGYIQLFRTQGDSESHMTRAITRETTWRRELIRVVTDAFSRRR
jgi:hypothetical protein